MPEQDGKAIIVVETTGTIDIKLTAETMGGTILTGLPANTNTFYPMGTAKMVGYPCSL